MKAMFHWARKNDILEHIPNIDAVSRGKIIHQQRFTFSSQDVTKLLAAADAKMRAMIWLGLNCGFGCTDCARLKWTDLDFEHDRVKLARNKTGVPRNLPLWPETLNAMEALAKTGPLVFYTEEGHPWVRTAARIGDDGSTHYTAVNAIASMFARLLKNVKINVPRGTGFYTLRRTAATLAARSGDPFAVQRLLGHVNLEMATRYVQDLSAQTDRVIENSRAIVEEEASRGGDIDWPAPRAYASERKCNAGCLPGSEDRLYSSQVRRCKSSVPTGGYCEPNSQYDAKTARSAKSTSQSRSKSAGTLAVVNDQTGPFVCPQVFLATTCQ
jgi:site-specific recombinase XerD